MINCNWNKRIARNLWWTSGVAVIATFNLLMLASSFWPPIFRYTDGDTLSEALSLGNAALGIVIFFSSTLLFLAVSGTSRWRCARLFLLGTTSSLFWGNALSSKWRFDVFHPGWNFPVSIDEIIYSGLLLVWSLSLIFAALTWKPQAIK